LPPRHRDWLSYVQTLHSEAELAALRCSLQRGALFGLPTWVERTVAEFGLESSLRPPGRPQKRPGRADDEVPLLRQEL
jgi:putative transposase